MKHKHLISLTFLSLLLSTASSCSSYKPESNIVSNIPNDNGNFDDSNKDLDKSEEDIVDDEEDEIKNNTDVIKRALSSDFVYDLNVTRNEVTLISATNASITTLEIPSILSDGSNDYTITRIEDNAFNGLKNLTSVSIPDSVTYIGQKAFSNCSSLINIEVSNLNKKYTSIDGVVYTKAVTEIVLCPNGRVESVTVPRTVNKVKAYAFANCSKLTAVYLPSSIVSILEGAFYNCSSLTSITIPPSTVSIGNGAFSKSGLNSIVLPKNLKSIGSWAFKDATNLNEIVLPENIREIKSDTFFNCSSLNYVYLPTKLTSISHNAFNGCTSLSSITIPESVYTVGDYAFKNLKAGFELNLLSSEVPSTWSSEFNPDNYTVNLDYKNTNVVVAGDGVIYKEISNNEYMVVGLDTIVNTTKTITIYNWLNGKKVTKIMDNAFKGSDITRVTFGAVVEEGFINYIGRYAFADCKNLNIINSNSPLLITKFNEYVFSGCSALTDISLVSKIPNITTVGAYAFDSCSRIPTDLFSVASNFDSYTFNECKFLSSRNSSPTAFIFPTTDKLTNFNSFLFNDTKFTEFTFHQPIDFISPYAFDNMDALQRTWIRYNGSKNYTSKEGLLFKGDFLNTLYYIPSDYPTNLDLASATDAVYGVFDTLKNYSNMSISINRSNTTFFIENNILFQRKNGKVILLKCFSNESRIELTTKFDYISNSAFKGCSNLTNLILKDTGCVDIGSYSFKDCTNLKYVTLPSSLISIGANAFENCTSLLKPDLPDTLTYLPTGIFKNCTSLSVLKLPLSLTSIDDDAFNNCTSLKSLTIPNSVVDITDDAFNGCDNLTTITVDENNTSYYYRDGALYVAGYDSSTLTYNPKKLIQILNSKRTSFVLPSTVSSISDNAFKKCTSLTSLSVEQGNTTYSVKNNVLFEKNDGETTTSLVFAPSNITSLTLDKDVSYIKDGALDNTVNLSRVTVDNDNQWFSSDEYCFYNKDKTVLLRVLNNTNEVEINDSVEYITSGSFSYYLQDLNKLNTLRLPDNLKYISDDELTNFNSLTRLDFPNSYFVNNIKNKININNLTTLYIDGSCKDIPAKTFKGLTNLQEVHLNYGIETIGDEAFMNCSNLTKLGFNAHYTGYLSYIGNSAFKNCRNLQDPNKVIFPDDIIWTDVDVIVGESAFENCTSLTKYPLVWRAFYSRDSAGRVLQTRILPVLSTKAFKGCTGFIDIKIDHTLNGLPESVFENCTSLTSVTLPTSLKKDDFSQDAFKGCTNLRSFNISYSSTSPLGELYATDGVLYAKPTPTSSTYSELLKYPYAKSGAFAITSYESVRTINSRAFENCTGLTSLVFENNKQYITTIEQNTFKTCTKLQLITLNHNNIVRDCRSIFNFSTITNVYLTTDVTAISANSFYGLSDLKFVYFSAITNGTIVTVPTGNDCVPSITTIGNYAFYGCTKLVLGTASSYRKSFNELTTIGAYAFYNCRATPYFYVIRRKVITIGTNAFGNCNAEIHSNNSRFQASSATWNPSGCKFDYNLFDIL